MRPAGKIYEAADHKNCPNELVKFTGLEKMGKHHREASLTLLALFSLHFASNFFNQCGPDTTEEMQGEDPAAVFGDFTDGMFDYDTRNEDWRQIFTDLMKYWVAFADIDGFRLDQQNM